VQMYEELFRQHKDPLSDDFQREKRKLEGVERYLIQLWRDSLPHPPRQDECVASAEVLAVLPSAVLVVPVLIVSFALAAADAAWLAPLVPDAVLVVVEGALAEVPAAGPAFAGAATEARPDADGL
jgi:hypothetical protein